MDDQAISNDDREMRLVAIEKEGTVQDEKIILTETCLEAVAQQKSFYEKAGYDFPWAGYLAVDWRSVDVGVVSRFFDRRSSFSAPFAHLVKKSQEKRPLSGGKL